MNRKDGERENKNK